MATQPILCGLKILRFRHCSEFQIFGNRCVRHVARPGLNLPTKFLVANNESLTITEQTEAEKDDVLHRLSFSILSDLRFPARRGIAF